MSNSSDNQSVVPKFASFRPKQSTEGAHTSNPEGQNSGSLQLKDTPSYSVKEKRDREHKRKHQRKRSRSPSHDKQTWIEPSKANEDHSWGHTRGKSKSRPDPLSYDGDSNGFIIDRIGDPSNAVYGTIHRYSIPTYLRFGSGGVLGLPGLRIDRHTSDERGLIVSNGLERRIGKRTKYAFSKNESKKPRRLRVQRQALSVWTFGIDDDYVPFDRPASSKRRRNIPGNSSDSDSDESQSRYQSIEGQAKPTNGSVDGALGDTDEFEDTDEVAGMDVEEDLRQKTIELQRQLDLRPTDVEAWLALIDHQKLLFGKMDVFGGRKLTQAEERSLADIKISMYEKALEQITRDKNIPGRDRLLLGMMEEGSKIWDSRKTHSKWQKLVKENPDVPEIWTNYLNFQQTNFLTFKFDTFRKVCTECIRNLKAALSKLEETNLSERTRLENILIYVVLRLTSCAREAGFSELATAIWQAILEFNFFKPSHISWQMIYSPVLSNEAIASFSDFWESEVPRIGEVGAKGWAAFTLGQGEFSTRQKNDHPDSILFQQNIFKTWADVECKRSLASRHPARSMDEIADDDPFRVIVASDIQDFLFLLSAQDGIHRLVQGFLSFANLPQSYSPSSNLSQDPFLRNEMIESSQSWIDEKFFRFFLFNGSQQQYYANPNSDNTHGRIPTHPLVAPFGNFLNTTDTLFTDSDQWFNSFNRWKDIYPEDSGPVEVLWVRNILQSLVTTSSVNDDLVEYFLAFELMNFPESVEKTAKKLLKQRGSSLRLYNAYAQVESRLGKFDTAHHVTITAINMTKTLKEIEQIDNISLWRGLIWRLLESGIHEGALYHLLSIAGETITERPSFVEPKTITERTEIEPAVLLRARRQLIDRRDMLLYLRKPDHAVQCIECLAILTYLSQKYDIDAATEVFRSLVPTLQTSGFQVALEQLHQAHARLLYFHVNNTHFFRPSNIRQELTGFIVRFPQNTLFLSLYAWNESRFRIDDRVRGIMRDIVLGPTQESVVGWMFSLWTELRRLQFAGATSNAVRAVFEHALSEKSNTKYSAAFWKLYVLFELTFPDAGGAKTVFYRGMRHLPWCKHFIMLAYTTDLRKYLSHEELRRIYNTLGEKELRIHVELENIITTDAEIGPAGRMDELPMNMPLDESSRDE